MNEAGYRVLLIEDNPGDIRLVRLMLGPESSLQLDVASTLAEGLERLQQDEFDVVLVDLGLPDSQGLQTFTRLRDQSPRIPAVVLTGNNDVDLAVLALQSGAQDYLVKGEVSGSLLMRTARYAIERKKTEEALRDSEAQLVEAQQIARIGNWILYPESGELRASAEMFRMFAVDPGRVAPLRLFIDGIHEEDRAGVEAGFAAALQTGTLDIEFRIVTPDGTRVARAIGRKREGGESRLSLVGTTQDITERQAAEEALRQQTESLERSNAELERFNRLAVGRELRMIELKRQINDLCAQLGQPAPYVLPEERALAKETS
jgi:DNA-binding response OmpR family regulator